MTISEENQIGLTRQPVITYIKPAIISMFKRLKLMSEDLEHTIIVSHHM